MNNTRSIESIYKLILENLKPSAYNILISEEQEVVMREVGFLMHCPELNDSKKRQLSNAVELLNEFIPSQSVKLLRKENLANYSREQKLGKIHFKEFNNLDSEYKAFVRW